MASRKYPPEDYAESKRRGRFRKARVIVDHTWTDARYWVRKLNGRWSTPFDKWEEAMNYANHIVCEDREVDCMCSNVD